MFRSWLAIERIQDGSVTIDPDELDGSLFATDRYETWIRRGELSPARGGAVRIDATVSPMRMDLLGDLQGSGGDRHRNVRPCIFKFDGDHVVIAYGKGWVKERKFKADDDSKGRPTEFKSTKENGFMVETLKPCKYLDQD